MVIAIVGTRGAPARYGGFETFAEELGARLAERGHEVVVYCRERPAEPLYRGMRLRYLPTIRHKYLDTVAHTFLSTLDLVRVRPHVALYCNAANAAFTALPRALGTPVALNVDGLERHRKKWNALGKAWYRMGERFSTWFPNAVVTDAQAIADYYEQRYGLRSHFIPYGAETGKAAPGETLARLGLEPGKYFLYVSRFEPENNALLVREAFERIETEMKLVLVGDAPYAREYIAQVRETTDSRVALPGAIYGEGYHELQSNCYAYIHATEVGGTHPALIEALGRGALTLFLNTPENEEAAGGAAIPFEREELPAAIRRALDLTAAEQEEWRMRAVARVRERYSWEAVTDSYEALFLRLLGKR